MGYDSVFRGRGFSSFRFKFIRIRSVAPHFYLWIKQAKHWDANHLSESWLVKDHRTRTLLDEPRQQSPVAALGLSE